jgi:carboxymethylenebutenolidase
VAETEAELKKHGKDYEFHMYPEAGHGFFAVDRPSYRQQAAVDGWEKVLAFFGKHLSAAAGQTQTANVREAVPAGDS